MTKRQNRQSGRLKGRGGAAAFAVGLFLAGSQAVATADSQQEPSGSGTSAESGAKSVSPRGSAPRAGTRSAPGAGRDSDVAAARRGGEVVARSIVTDPTETEPRGSRVVDRQFDGQSGQPASALPVPRNLPTPVESNSLPQAGSRFAPVQAPAPAAAQAASAVTTVGPSRSDAPLGKASSAAVDTYGSEVISPTGGSDLLLGAAPTAGGNPLGTLAGVGAPAIIAAPAPVASGPVMTMSRPKGVLAVADQLNDATVKVFDTLANWTAMLPNQNLGDIIGGALLEVRRKLINQAPTASPVQQTTTSAGLILGTVGGDDAEADPLRYTVVTNGQFGSVTVNQDGKYIYTPGAGYAGTDTFTVAVQDTSNGFNVFYPGTVRSTEVQITVGAGAATDPFYAGNRADGAFFLRDTVAQVSVARTLQGLTGTITLDIPGDTKMVWLDDEGRIGRISVADVAKRWDGIASAGDVTAGITYTLDDGTSATMMLQSVEATSAGPGQYVLTGVLAPDVTDGDGVDSEYDITGAKYNASYDNFRAKVVNGLGLDQVSFSVVNADVHLDTFNVADYEQVLARQGNDRGVPLVSSPAGSAKPGAATATSSKAAVAQDPRVVTMITYSLGPDKGLGYALGQRDGAVQLFTQDGGFKEVLPASGSPVVSLIADPVGDGFYVGLADATVKKWTGTTLTTLNRGTAGTSDVQTLAVTPDGKVFQAFTNVVWERDSATGKWTSLKNPDGSDFAGTLRFMVPHKSSVAIATDNGEYRWTGSQWQQLGVTESAPTAMASLSNGDFGVGYENGHVYRFYTDTDRFGFLGDPGDDSPVRQMKAFGDGFIITKDGDQAFWQDPDYGWRDIALPEWSVNSRGPNRATSLNVFNDTVVVGTSDGAVLALDDVAVRRGTGSWFTLADQGSLDPLIGAGNGGSSISAALYTPAVKNASGQVVSAQKLFVGTDNGVVARGTEDGSTLKFTLLRDLTSEAFGAGKLREAVEFAAQDGAVAGSAADPLFSQYTFRPACESDSSCQGEIYTLNLSQAPEPLFSKEFPLTADGLETNQKIALSFDVGRSVYGYVYVPDGLWDKLDMDLYSFAVMLAMTTGPSVSVGIGDGGTITVGETTLASFELPAVPAGPVNFTVGGEATAQLDVILGLPEGFDKDALTAYAYLTGGVVLAYNTRGASWYADSDYYTDINFDDFKSVESVSLVPTLTPSITATVGVGLAGIPVINTLNAGEIGLTYRNPVTLDLTVSKNDPPSLTLGSSGELELEAALVPDLTDALSFGYVFPLYDVKTDNLLPAEWIV